jgi:Flp pilus assembly protein TadD
MPDAALRIFSGLVKKNPNNPVFRYHLGATLAARGDNAGARSELGAALLKNPDTREEAEIKSLLAQLR